MTFFWFLENNPYEKMSLQSNEDCSYINTSTWNGRFFVTLMSWYASYRSIIASTITKQISSKILWNEHFLYRRTTIGLFGGGKERDGPVDEARRIFP